MLKKIKELESEIKEKNIIIRNISNKNIKLNNSLADFSKRLDKEMTKKKEKINNKTNINETGKVKEKELDNAVNMIKILRNDSSRLQKIIDENKKQLEYENKKYENILALNNNFKTKIEKLEEKIKKLCQENNDLKMNLKKEEEKYNKLLEKNFYKNNSQRNNSDKKNKSNIDNAIKNYKINSKIVPTIKKSNYFKQNDKNLKNSSSLPRLHLKNLKIKNNNEIDNDDLRIIFNKEEITRINSIFENDNNLLEILINKINILNQSKESSNKKNNYEKKKLNEKIITMQKHIESLEKIIKEKEMEVNIQKSEKNKKNDINKKLLGKLKNFYIKKEEIKSSSQITINENNLDEIDNILNNLDKNNKDIINKFKFLEKDSPYTLDEKNKILKKDKHNDNKIFIKIIKK